MKRLLLSLIILPLVTVPVLAQNVDSANTRLTASPLSSPQVFKKMDRVENRLEIRQTKRAEFKERLAIIKDTKKKQIIERVNTQINELNSKITTNLQAHLTKLEEILTKVKARKPDANTANAQAKIEEAKTAVTTQAEMEYTIEFTDENGLRVGASAAKTKFRTDIKVVRDKVLAARQAVGEVLKTINTQ